PDGKFILFRQTTPEGDYDLWLAPVSGDGKPIPYLQTSFQESEGRFSPDGKWVSYTSNEFGRQEICVRSFPAGPNRQQVSVEGGSASAWRRDGKEIFFRSPDGNLMAVSVESGSTGLRFGKPQLLFPLPGQYDVSPDGRRFLLAVPQRGPEAALLNVVLN